MAVKVLIKRKCPREQEKELFKCIREIRRLVPQQSGYISGEYLKSIGQPNEIATISSWFSLEDWQFHFHPGQFRAISWYTPVQFSLQTELCPV